MYDWVCSHHGLVYTATVSNGNYTVFFVSATSAPVFRTLVFSCAVAGGSRTVAGEDMHSTMQHRSMEHPAIPPRVVCFFILCAFFPFFFFYL